MENQQQEALDVVEVAEQLENGFITLGKTARELRYSAAATIHHLHARVEELEKDRENAKRLVSKIWNQHPEARDTIEKATGAWLVFGQDVETDGVSAQRVTQGKDHFAQDSKMVAAQEPFGYFKAKPFGWRDCAETDEGAIALYEAPQPQADGRDVERLFEIVRAIERAFQELPENFAINIKLAKGVAAGFLSGPGLTERRIANGDFVEDINAAIDAAIAAAKGK